MEVNQVIVGADFSTVVHVVETPGDGEALQPAVEHWHVNGQGQLARQIESCAAGDVDIAQEIVDAPSVAEGLQASVDSHRADLVVVGSTGLTGIKQTLLGSTAQKALRTVEAHIMVARGEKPPASGYGRILIPTDFSLSTQKALELAVALAAPDAQWAFQAQALASWKRGGICRPGRALPCRCGQTRFLNKAHGTHPRHP